MKRLLILLLSATAIIGFTALRNSTEEEQPTVIPRSTQRTGDAAKGYQYLVAGDYLKSGIPYSVFQFGIRKDTNNFLGRAGINKTLPYDYTAVRRLMDRS
jgi:hypothetical protein